MKAVAYVSMVGPAMECACTVWDTLNQNKIKTIEQVKKEQQDLWIATTQTGHLAVSHIWPKRW